MGRVGQLTAMQALWTRRPLLSGIRRTWSLLVATALLALAAGARSELNDSTPVFIIRTEAEAKQAIALHATGDREVMFTTVSFTHKGYYAGHMADFAAHLAQSLREIGRLENAIIISYDLHTCQGIMQRGIPCFLDRWSVQPVQLPGQYGKEVPHWYSKYSWALAILEWGYTAIFIEMDMVFMADPLPHFKRDVYDLEGLSDWRVPEVPDPKVRFTDTCSVYHVVKKADGGQTLDWGPSDPEDPRSTKHVNPCMSTGFWFVQPTEAAKKYFRDFIQLAVYEMTEEVDQIVWNEAIMAFLIGSARFSPPLRIGLLDDEKFSNFAWTGKTVFPPLPMTIAQYERFAAEVYNWRVEKGLPTNPIMLHCGALAPSDKWPMLNQLGFWKAGWWDPSAAEPLMRKLSQRMARGVLHHHRHRQVESI